VALVDASLADFTHLALFWIWETSQVTGEVGAHQANRRCHPDKLTMGVLCPVSRKYGEH